MKDDFFIRERKKDDVTQISNKLSKKVYYYDSVDIMKNSSELRIGELVITSGFYSAKDGGGATYQITNDNSDGYFVHTLTNGLKATLVIPNNNTVNIKQIGGKPQDLVSKYDNKQYIDAYIARLNASSNKSYRFKLYIPSGVWCFSPTTLYRYAGFSITGDFNFQLSVNSSEGTVITAFADNQDYVWSIGNGTGLMYNFEIGNFTVSTANYRTSGSYLVKDILNGTSKGALIIQGVGFGYVKPILFSEIKGKAIDITSSWETTFDKLIFRGIDDYATPVMNFSPLLASLSAYLPNLSNLIFDTLDFEGCAGHLINIQTGAYLLNSEIKTIVSESSFKNADNVTYVTDASYNDATATKFAIMNVEGELNGNHIGSILLNNFSWHLATKNSVQYVYDTIFNLNGNNTPVNIGVDCIAIAGVKKDYNIILQTSLTSAPSSLSKFYVGRIEGNYEGYRGIFNVKRFPSIKVGDMRYADFHYDGNYLAPNMIPFYDLQHHVKGQYSYAGMLYFDASVMNKMSLAVFPLKWVGAEAQTVARFLNDSSKKINIRAKIQNGVTMTFVLKGMVGGVETTQNVALVGTGAYKWYDLITTNTFDDATYVTISVGTDKDAYLDILRYI